jgi:hypothetical protein
MQYLEDEDIEVTEPSQYLEDEDIEVSAPPTLPEKLASGIEKSTQASIEPVVQTAEDYGAPAVQTAVDTARGVGAGLTLGSIDEIGGALSAGVESLYNKFNPTDAKLREQGFNIEQPDMAELYRKNQQDIQKELESSEERSPVLYTAGQIGGGIASGSMLGAAAGLGKVAPGTKNLLQVLKDEGKARAAIELLKRGGTTYVKAAPAIAAESALSSRQGGLINEEERGKLAEDVVGGLAFGLPAVLGLQAVSDAGIPALQKGKDAFKSKVKETVEDSPLLRQMRASYNYGIEGINPRSTKVQLATDLGKTNIAEIDNTRVKALMDELYKADEQIAKAVGQSLESATAAGKTVDLSGDVSQSIGQLMNIAAKYPELADNAKANQIFSKIAQNRGQVTPIEAHDLVDYVDSYINKFKSATNKTPLEQSILSNLISTRKSLSSTLKGAVPEYQRAAERMASFRKLGPETIIAGNRPVDVTDTYFGDLRNQDQQMFDSLKKLLQGTTKTGTGTAETRTAFVNTIKGLKEFEAQEAARLAAGQIPQSSLARPVSEIEKQIIKYSDDAVARGSMDAISPQTGIKRIGVEAITGAGAETGRSIALAASNKAGLLTKSARDKAIKNPVAKLGRGIYNAPNELVSTIATKLEATPGLEKYGKTLAEAIRTGNNNKKNQALFTIMQNPSARLLVGEGTEEEE